MAELTTEGRDKLRSSQLAYVDSNGREHLPIHDESQVRNAIARFIQTDFESAAAKERARRNIMAAARPRRMHPWRRRGSIWSCITARPRVADLQLKRPAD